VVQQPFPAPLPPPELDEQLPLPPLGAAVDGRSAPGLKVSSAPAARATIQRLVMGMTYPGPPAGKHRRPPEEALTGVYAAGWFKPELSAGQLWRATPGSRCRVRTGKWGNRRGG
jgi:hypothetical protein